MADGRRAELRTALNRVRRRWLVVRWLLALSRVAAGACVGLLLVVAADALLALPDAPLLAVVGVVALATLAFAARVLWPLRRPPSDDRVARFVEERCPDLEDRVASAAVLAASGPAAGFGELLLADAAERLRGVDPARVVSPVRVRRAAARGLLALVAFAAAVVVGSAPLSRVADAARLHVLPSGVELLVEPGDFRLVAGQPFRVRARFSGAGGALGRTPPVLSVLDDLAPRQIHMRPADGGWLAEFPSVARSFRYRVEAGALASRGYLVEALSPPRVTRIDVEYTYSAFTGLAPRVEEDGGDLFAPADTVARLVVHTDKPVVRGELALSDGRRLALDDAGDGRRAATLAVEGDGRYSVRVVDVHGLSNLELGDYLVRASADRPPAVRVVRPGGDREVTPLEEVTVEVRAGDDHAVDRLDLVYTVVGREDRVLPFDIPEQAAAVAGVRTLFVEDLAVEPGDVITYFARARDAGPAGASNEARSDLYFLEVRPFDNAFEEALSQGGAGPQAAEMGRLAALQKQIIVATWRLDQRAGGGRAEDVRTVAEAQAGLRDTTAAAAGNMTPGRGRPADAGVGPRGAADEFGPEAQGRALAAAVKAMDAASAALDAQDTAAALPYETDALNRLLTAQAAVRRRQVSMQPGGGSGGQQAQLDLSALFDRELRREQETSFETGGQPGEAQPDDDREVLDRLRELARRQERINRDLRSPPETDAEEERRRRLERLRREQQALRAELEALTERLGRPSGSAGQSGMSGSAEQSGASGQSGSEGSSGSQGTESSGQSWASRSEGSSRLPEGSSWSEGSRSSGPSGSAGSSGAAGQSGSAGSESAGQSGSAPTAREELRRAAEQMQRAASGLRRDDGTAARGHGDQAADALRRLADRLRAGGLAAGTAPADAQGAAAGRRQAGGQDEELRRLAAELEVARRLRLRLQGASEDEDAPGSARAANASPGDARAPGSALGGSPSSDSPAPDSARGGSPSGDSPASASSVRTLPGELDARGRHRDGSPAPASPSAVGSGSAAERSDEEGGRFGGGAEPSGRAAVGIGAGADAASEPADSIGAEADAAGELARHPGLLSALREIDPELAADLEAWAGQRRSPSAPGTDPARLDFARWTSLRRGLVTALLRIERDRSQELADLALRDRYAAGTDDAVPERYRRLVERYYRSLAVAPRTVR